MRGPSPRPEAGIELLYGVHAVTEALRAGRRPLQRLWIRPGRRSPALASLAARARTRGVEVDEADRAFLEAGLPPGTNAQGVVLEAGPLPVVPLEELACAGEGARTRRLVVALDGVEDPQNVGAVVRVAEAAGASGLVLTRRRAPPLGPAVARASAGALEFLPVSRVPNLGRALNLLKKRGFWVLGADAERGDDLFQLGDRVLEGDLVLVLGAEGRGLRRGIVSAVDRRIRIPVVGRVRSLNVAAAAAVTLFEIRRRSGAAPSG